MLNIVALYLLYLDTTDTFSVWFGEDTEIWISFAKVKPGA